MDVYEFLSNASKDDLTTLLSMLKAETGLDEICESLQELITLY